MHIKILIINWKASEIQKSDEKHNELTKFRPKKYV